MSTGAFRLAAALLFIMHSAQVFLSLPVRGWMKSPAGFVFLQELQCFVPCIVLGGAPVSFWGLRAAPIWLSRNPDHPQSEDNGVFNANRQGRIAPVRDVLVRPRTLDLR